MTSTLDERDQKHFLQYQSENQKMITLESDFKKHETAMRDGKGSGRYRTKFQNSTPITHGERTELSLFRCPPTETHSSTQVWQKTDQCYTDHACCISYWRYHDWNG